MTDQLDLDDIPDTKDLVPPTPAEIPTAVLGNTLGLRRMRREVAAMKRLATRVFFAILGGSVTVATSVLGGAVYVGARTEHVAQHDHELERLDDRVTRLEQKAMEDPR